MNTFRTVIPLKPSDWKINHTYSMMLLGSCFAENIGQKLSAYKFQTLQNPFGILYNPQTISQNLSYLISNKNFTEKDLFIHQRKWHSFDHHGSFSNGDQKAGLVQINAEIQKGHSLIKELDCLIVTLGSAHAFYHKKNNQVVANCHKLPNANFERRLLTVAQIVENLAPIFTQLKKQSPKLRIILTVSPVRYRRDGLIASNQSKATLLLAVHQLCRQHSYVEYFPAYELVTDDLRDYRFFKEDMAHPNATAVDYVWNFFEKTYFDAGTKAINAKIGKLRAAMNHRPLDPKGNAHQRFKASQLAGVKSLQAEYPKLDFREEEAFFGNVV